MPIVEKLSIISQAYLDQLVAKGILYKDSGECYNPLIDKDRWSEVCMPYPMVGDVAGKTLNLTKVDKLRWQTSTENGNWYIGPWMLEENYTELITHGKYRPEPFARTKDGYGVYMLKIMDFMHLEQLVLKGVLTKEKIGDEYYYHPCVDDMGNVSMPKMMADQLCGRMIKGQGTESSWAEVETEHRWNIAQWMLADNYDYLLERLKGEMNTEQFEPEEEEPEEEEEETHDWNEAHVVGVIKETNPECITIDCTNLPVPVICYGDAEGHGIGERVKVRGTLRRVYNMMGYPEIDISYIEEY